MRPACGIPQRDSCLSTLIVTQSQATGRWIVYEALPQGAG